ncbi:MAG: thiamine biosynthesis protein ThiS [Acidimicrobiia bacterium]
MRIVVNGEVTEVEDGTSLLQLVVEKCGPEGEPVATITEQAKSQGQLRSLEPRGHRRPPGVAVAVNSEVVPRSKWADVALRAGDRIEILGASQGG